LRRAYEHVEGHLYPFDYTPLPSSPKPEYTPDKLASVASKISQPVDEEFLRLRSKFTVDNRSPAGALHKLYLPGENVLVFTHFYSQGKLVGFIPALQVISRRSTASSADIPTSGF
jgi:hypothetical protein